jgi:hypothetical protein
MATTAKAGDGGFAISAANNAPPPTSSTGPSPPPPDFGFTTMYPLQLAPILQHDTHVYENLLFDEATQVLILIRRQTFFILDTNTAEEQQVGGLPERSAVKAITDSSHV